MRYNVYFYFSWNFSYLAHAIASEFQKDDRIERVGGTVVGREYYEYLQNQDEVDYDPLVLYQDLYNNRLTKTDVPLQELSKLEERFGLPSLQRYVLADRTFSTFGHEKQRRVVGNLINFYTELFEEYQPDVYIGPVTACGHAFIPFQLIDQDYGTSIQWNSTRVGDLIGLQNNPYDDFEGVHDLFDRLQEDPDLIEEYPDSRREAREYLEEFRKEELRPGFVEINESRSGTRSLISLLRGAMIHFWRYNFGYYQGDYTQPSTLEKTVDTVRQAYRKRRIRNLDVFDEPRFDEDYVFYPLHINPEATTLMLAPMYLDQSALIKQISGSLPLTHKLYVKEHPQMVGPRDLTYYDRFEEMANVRLIHPGVNSHKLIRNSDMVATITGTGGLEGLMYEKPVMVFGRPNYRVLPMVYDGGDPSNLSEQIDHALNQYEHEEIVLLRYLTAIFERSIRGLYDVDSDDPEYMRNAAMTLLPYIKENIFNEGVARYPSPASTNE